MVFHIFICRYFQDIDARLEAVRKNLQLIYFVENQANMFYNYY